MGFASKTQPSALPIVDQTSGSPRRQSFRPGMSLDRMIPPAVTSLDLATCCLAYRF